MKKLVLILPLLLLISSCTNKVSEESIEKWKQEIVDTEIAFSNLAQEKSIAEAFYTFAADDATILRGKDLVHGKEAIRASFGESQSNGKVSLVWKPDFVDVAASGDLGYTYGGYTITETDSTGAKKISTGVFQTIWKRQTDGTWKFVWD